MMIVQNQLSVKAAQLGKITNTWEKQNNTWQQPVRQRKNEKYI